MHYLYISVYWLHYLLTKQEATQWIYIYKLGQLLQEAQAKAIITANHYFDTRMDGQDSGFAWVEIPEYNGKPIKGNTKIGKMLKELGVTQDYKRIFHIWNPSRIGAQNIDVKEHGAMAYAEVLKKAGFKAYMCSRLD